MELVIIIVFVAGYLAIALEHPIKINKTASALLTAVICWTIFTVSGGENHLEFVEEELGHHLKEIAAILFFLMGAMTIVELVDAHHGFKFITDRIKTKSPILLLWVVCIVAFFLSSVLDNLTTTIVMVSLVRKLVLDKEMKLFFVGMIVISANAGGAWSPIGDVTTTMLWIGGQISAASIMKSLFIPSIICTLVPLLFLTFTMKGTLGEFKEEGESSGSSVKTGNLMLVLGIGALISVPIFKTLTHLPPYLGMLLGLGVLWVVSELINPHMDEFERKHYTAGHALSRIDMPSVLFFLGILLAVGALQSMGTLANFAAYLDEAIGNKSIIITLIGVLSAIVDNVPLVAASMGMYSLEKYPVDHFIWTYLAYCAGTGGSILIIGSAAGVAAMGMEKIEFGWYLKRISFLAALGYFAGAGVYLLMMQL
ncbi:MAG: sodium:proton antiporter NhaD [Bacteroidetes bacterium]|nr:sodium:proton antiporter NhaD [Bacteroidota bacterium]